MKITRTSIKTGITRVGVVANLTAEQLEKYWRGIDRDALDHLSKTDREFIHSGMTDAEWGDDLDEDTNEELEENPPAADEEVEAIISGELCIIQRPDHPPHVWRRLDGEFNPELIKFANALMNGQ